VTFLSQKEKGPSALAELSSDTWPTSRAVSPKYPTCRARSLDVVDNGRDGNSRVEVEGIANVSFARVQLTRARDRQDPGA
jgi:hypothetical protein